MKRLMGNLGLVLIILLVTYFAFSKLAVTETQASSHENLMRGYAWSSNIGWISLSCANDNCSTSNYQVKIDPFNGKFSGYAWSSNIGWIRFDIPGPYPEAPNNHATLVTIDTPTGRRNQVQGWARACAVFDDPRVCSGSLSLNAGGWDGWIKMSGSSANGCPPMSNPSPSEYETCVASDGQSLEGWAWGGDVVGWIQFDPNFNDIFVPGSSTKIKEVRPR